VSLRHADSNEGEGQYIAKNCLELFVQTWITELGVLNIFNNLLIDAGILASKSLLSYSS
jgi:hypothetical protein